MELNFFTVLELIAFGAVAVLFGIVVLVDFCGVKKFGRKNKH